MERQETSKLEKLNKCLDSLEQTQVMLLDMLRAKELTQREYSDMIANSQQAYNLFLKDIHKPINEKDVLPNEQE